MELSRRDFIKLSGVTTGGLLLPAGITGAALAQAKPFPLHKPIGETPTICPFCAVGCGAIVAAQDGQGAQHRGRPRSSHQPGQLCAARAWPWHSSTPSTARSTAAACRRSSTARPVPPTGRRSPGIGPWTRSPSASRTPATQHFIENDGEGRTVNRLEAIASLGGAALDNEECSLIVKAMRALGLVYIEHQARI